MDFLYHDHMAQANVKAKVTGSATRLPPMGFRAWRTQPRPMENTHQHHDLELNLVEAGWVEYLMGGQRIRIRAGQLALFWAAVPHQMTRVDAGAVMAWVVFPLEWLRDWHLADELTTRLVRGQMLVTRQQPRLDGDDATRWIDMLARDDVRWRRLAALEVEARIGRMALEGDGQWLAADASHRDDTDLAETTGQAATPRAGHHVTSPVERMALLLTEHFRQPLRVDDVAGHVGLNPSYAMRLFRRELGVTIVEFLTRQRVFAAQHLLLTTDRSVLNVALDSGFGSLSQFHAAFRRIVHTSPAAFRRAARLRDA
jgi:AraC family transcriptional regulator, melibiose operon regulatory protein